MWTLCDAYYEEDDRISLTYTSGYISTVDNELTDNFNSNVILDRNV